VNSKVGDAIMVLNNERLLAERHIFSRVVTAVVQYAAGDPYPPKTHTLNCLHDEVKAAWESFRAKLAKVDAQSVQYECTKRFPLRQHSVGGASIYPLSKNDTNRRLADFERIAGRPILPGPTLLIQREAPMRRDRKCLAVDDVDFEALGSEGYLWDGRLVIRAFRKPESPGTLRFSIEPLSLELVHRFEKATDKNRRLRKNLYAFLGTTPATHLHVAPVLMHLDSGYMAIPSLNCSTNPELIQWNVFNTANGILAGKFACSP
jgi:hypothetical protein